MDSPALLCTPDHLRPTCWFAPCSGRAECLLLDVWERLRVLCSQNCEAQRYDFGSVLERAAELGAKRLIICDPGGWRGGQHTRLAPSHELACAVLVLTPATTRTHLPHLQMWHHLSAGVRRVRAKVALNVAPNDLLMVLSSDAELPWLEAAISRAAATAPVMAAE